MEPCPRGHGGAKTLRDHAPQTICFNGAVPARARRVQRHGGFTEIAYKLRGRDKLQWSRARAGTEGQKRSGITRRKLSASMEPCPRGHGGYSGTEGSRR